MDNSGLSASDVLALTRNNDGMFSGAGSSWLIILLLFWGFMGNGFGGFGNANVASTVGSEMADRDILTTAAQTQAQIAQTNYNTLLGNKDLQAQFSTCCCENRLATCQQTNEIVNAIHSDGDKTRTLLTDQIIQQLRDQLTAANLQISENKQTDAILGQLGRYVPYTDPIFYQAYKAATTSSSTNG